MENDRQKGKQSRHRKSGSASRSEREEPAAIETAKPRTRRFEIDIFRDWCKSCGICAAFCPRECIMLDEEGAPTKIDSDRCTGCGWCEMHCPDFAISVHQKDSHQ